MAVVRYRTLGRTGVQVSAVGLGGNQFGGTCDERSTAAIVARALECGVNFVDTAESYSAGKSEEFLGKALGKRRREVVLATKAGARGDPGLEAGGRLTRRQLVDKLDASLRRLGTDWVDLYYFHFPDPLTPIDESLRAAADLISAGKARYLACSNYSAWQVAEMAGICERRGYAPPVASQMPYSLLDRTIESEMVPACAHLGLSIVPYSPLAGGFLTGKYTRTGPPPEGARLTRNERARQARLTPENFDRVERYEAFAPARGHTIGELAVSWLLANPVVCSVIAGATRPEQVESNVRAAEWALAPEDLRELDGA